MRQPTPKANDETNLTTGQPIMAIFPRKSATKNSASFTNIYKEGQRDGETGCQPSPEGTGMPNGIFDELWHGLVLRGDDQAWQQLARVAQPLLYRFCLCRVGNNHDDCEEAVQETLCQALNKLSQYDPIRSAAAIRFAPG